MHHDSFSHAQGYDQKGKHFDDHKGSKGHYGQKGKFGKKSSFDKGGKKKGYGDHDSGHGYGHGGSHGGYGKHGGGGYGHHGGGGYGSHSQRVPVLSFPRSIVERANSYDPFAVKMRQSRRDKERKIRREKVKRLPHDEEEEEFDFHPFSGFYYGYNYE